jgi:hypothetical protein
MKGKDIQSTLAMNLKPPIISKATALLCTDGPLRNELGEVAIIKPLVNPKEITGKMLQTKRKGQADYEKWVIDPGLNIIGDDLHYLWPNVPFIVLHATIMSS